MVRRELINGVEVVVEARAVGGLGWTWSYYPEKGSGRSNTGRLLTTEAEAFDIAIAEAKQQLGDSQPEL
jgi:hypothetical protein